MSNEPLEPSTLQLAVGGGHIARRSTALLFLPETDATLLEAFAAAIVGGELQAVASATVASGFDVARFVAVSWSGGAVRVMAFGDVAVETDQPTLPMLTGAGSRTWVEHTLTPDGPATVSVSVDGLDPASDLRDGVAPGGGFRLELGPTEAATDPLPAPVGVPADLPDPTEAAVRPDLDEPGPAARPPDVDPDDAQGALAAIQAAAMGEDGSPVRRPDAGPVTAAPPPAASAPTSEVDPDVTLPPPDVGELLEDLGRAAAGRSSLLDAKLCTRQHANPPTVATCAICGELLPPGTLSVVHVARPRLGALRLDDGTILPLDHEVLIGRNPARDETPERSSLERVRVLGDKVSRSHVAVRFQGWDLVVADCGSTNGTFIVPHPGGQVMALDGDRPQLVEPGATVYFGSRSFTVLGRQDA